MVNRGRNMASRCSRKPEVTFSTPDGTTSRQPPGAVDDETRHYPNVYLWRKLEALMERMQCEDTGIPVRNFKSLMSTVPSVFTGGDLLCWLMRNIDIDDVIEAIHTASMISGMGYLFPIDDHVLAVKNDHSLYRFQTPCLYPSRCQEADGVDYAVYLSKRTMQNKQRLELADYEAERLARLQSLYCHKWEFIYMQAEAEAKVDKKRDKFERLVLESQERAFWDVNRPAPGCVNTTELDMRKLCRAKRPKKNYVRPVNYPVSSGPGGKLMLNGFDHLNIHDQAVRLNLCSERTRIKATKAAENLLNYHEQYSPCDLLLTVPASLSVAGGGNSANPTVQEAAAANPWVSDNAELWDSDLRIREVPLRRVKRWSYSIHELLRDPAGRGEFQRWLEREFSAENLRFWEGCQELKGAPLRELGKRIKEIYEQYLAQHATEPLNVDSRVAEAVRKRVADSPGSNPDRYCFEEAEDHIFKLMKNDSYNRFLRSEVYKEFLAGQKKKQSKKRFPSDVRQRVDVD